MNRLSTKICLYMIGLVYLIQVDELSAQSPFNIIIDHGGPTGQSRDLVCMTQGDTIYVIGDYIDSARTNIWPILSTFDFDGQLIHQKHLVDATYDSDFAVQARVAKHISQDHIIYVSFREIHPSKYFFAYLMDINVRTGQIVKSKTFNHDHVGEFQYMNFNAEDSTISMVFYQLRQDDQDIVIIELDLDFNIIRTIHTPFSKYHVPFYIEKNGMGDYEIIGDKRIFGKTADDDSLFIFHTVIDTSGHVIDYDIHDFGHRLLFGVLTTYTVVKYSNNNWVITAKESETNIDCTHCTINNVFPHVFSYSSDFDTLLWTTPFFTKPFTGNPGHRITRLIKVEDDSGYITIGSKSYRDSTRSYGNGWAFKVSSDGDSLWSHTYLPATKTKDDLIISVTFEDIAYFNNAGYVITGQIMDGNLRKFRSILLYIDKDGCLIPGCNTSVGTTDHNHNEPNKAFKIYPNPADDVLYLLSYFNSNKTHEVRLCDLSGRILEQYYIAPQQNGQYILDLPTVNSGMYLLQMMDNKGQLIQTEKLMIK